MTKEKKNTMSEADKRRIQGAVDRTPNPTTDQKKFKARVVSVVDQRAKQKAEAKGR